VQDEQQEAKMAEDAVRAAEFTEEVVEEGEIDEQTAEQAERARVLSKLVRARFKSMEPFNNDYIVHDIIRPGTVTLFQGAPGSLKTWAALDLLRAAATGTKWLDTFQVDKVASLGIFLDSAPEDLWAQWRRLTQEQEEAFAQAALTEAEIEYDNPSFIDPLDEPLHPADESYYSPFNDLVHLWWPESPHIFAPNPMNLRIPKENERMVKDLEIMLKYSIHRATTRDTRRPPEELLRLDGGAAQWMDTASFGTPWGKQLLVIDSLSKIHGLDENSNTEMEYMVNFFQRLARSTGIAVVLLHHWGKGNEGDGNIHSGRGASRVPDGADTLINFIRQSGKATAKLVFEKVRGKETESFFITLDADAEHDADNRYLLSIQDRIIGARKAKVPLILDPKEHQFSRASLKRANAGPIVTEQLLLFIGEQPDGKIDVQVGRAWARELLGLSDTETATTKAEGYYRNRRGDLTKMHLIVATGKKGEYELTAAGIEQVKKLSMKEAWSQLAKEGDRQGALEAQADSD
jgi:hypothetical protein